MKKLFILAVVVFVSLPAFCSSVRLIAMGNMRGIVDDDSAYIDDISSMLRYGGSFIQSNSLYDNFVLSDPQAAPSDLRSFKGDEIFSSFDLSRSLTKDLRFYCGNVYSTKDNIGIYKDLFSNISENRVSFQDQRAVVGIGYSFLANSIIGVGFETSSQNFMAHERTNGSLSDSITENGATSDPYYSFGYNDERWACGFTYSNANHEVISKHKDNSANYDITNMGPIRSNGRISIKNILSLFGGSTDMNFGVYQKGMPLANEKRSFFGFEYLSADKKFILAVGTIDDLYVYPWQAIPADYVDINSARLGLEYKFTDYFALRYGVAGKTIDASYIFGLKPNKMFYDYSIGISTIWAGISIDLTYQNYQGRLMDYNECKPAAVREDSILLSDQRNSAVSLGIGYGF